MKDNTGKKVVFARFGGRPGTCTRARIKGKVGKGFSKVRSRVRFSGCFETNESKLEVAEG